eukprot:5777339-Pyramimonas_sp.AAC.1
MEDGWSAPGNISDLVILFSRAENKLADRLVNYAMDIGCRGKKYRPIPDREGHDLLLRADD